MSRALKKGPHVDLRLLAKVEKQGMNKDAIKTWSRDCTIVPEFIGATYSFDEVRLGPFTATAGDTHSEVASPPLRVDLRLG